jgi:hypothetical protein
MTSRIAASVVRVLGRVGRPMTHDDVHFHVDSDGWPFVCDYRRCESPGLTAGEAALARR